MWYFLGLRQCPRDGAERVFWRADEGLNPKFQRQQNPIPDPFRENLLRGGSERSLPRRVPGSTARPPRRSLRHRRNTDSLWRALQLFNQSSSGCHSFKARLSKQAHWKVYPTWNELPQRSCLSAHPR